MDYTHLGRTGLKVSPLCLGTMNFGMVTREEPAYGVMDAALEAGINFFDTANVYGRERGEGVTEQIIGRWFAQGGDRRDKVVLATKVFQVMGDWPNDGGGLSAYHIVRACEASLRRLQTDRIDLYQMHHVDRAAPWEEVWQAMETLVAQGKVIYVGSSNFAGWDLARAQEAARNRNFFGLVSEQSLYNLTARTVELEVVPACQHYGLGLIPWSPLAGGLLGGVLGDDDRRRRSHESVQNRLEHEGGRIEAYEKLCAELGRRPADVALAWLLAQPAVTAPIIGPRTVDQLHSALGALDVELSNDTLASLDELFPGPGGSAPEAYAW